MSESKDFINDAMERVVEIKDYCYKEGKKNGALDVWDFLKIWGKLSQVDRKKIFGVTRISDLVDKFTPTEAIDRFEESTLEKKDVDPEEICIVLNAMSMAVGWCSKERWALTEAIDFIERNTRGCGE